MKTALPLAAVLAAMLVPAGAATAQQWSGVSGVAASQGYSASPSMGMSIPVPVVSDAEPAQEQPAAIAPAPRARLPHTETASLIAGHRHPVRIARGATRRAPTIVARAKRPIARRRAKLA